MATVPVVPVPASAAVVASPIHDLDTSASGDGGGGGGGIWSCVMPKYARTDGTEERTEAAALRSINRRKTQDADRVGDGTDGRLPKMREMYLAGKGRRMDGSPFLIYPSVCLSTIIGRRIKGPPLVKGATREPISVGRSMSRAAAVG